MITAMIFDGDGLLFLWGGGIHDSGSRSDGNGGG